MNYAIILSGGIGTRMRTDGFPKQYIEINNKPILFYTLDKFQNSKYIDQIVIVADKVWHDAIREWINKYKVAKFVSFAAPGESRQESILNGLEVCKELSDDEADNVIVHDAVRPMLSLELIASCIDALDEHEGCMPALPVNDTTYQSLDGKKITGLLERKTLFAGQSPEAFKLSKYWEINSRATKEELASTKGTSEIAYKHGMDVAMIPGEDMNFKITTPADLNRFEKIVEE